MANLTTADLIEIGRLLRDKYSSEWQEMPFKKSQLLSFGTLVDVELEQLEIDAVQALPAGDLKQWLIDNAVIGREIVEQIAKARKENI